MFRKRAQGEIRELRQNLKEILDEDSGGRVTVFTDNKEIKELAAQINRLLEKNAKAEADFRRSEMSSRKMLSNISHDMKTPLTVIRGYLEIMRMQGEEALRSRSGFKMQEGSEMRTDLQMLEKAEQKTEALMKLIDSFFSLAKLEAGDTDVPLSCLDVCEVCRECVLDYYEILTGADFQVEIEVPEKPVSVEGNREALQRIFSNLISKCNSLRLGG